MYINEELIRMCEENQRIKEENLIIKQILDIQRRKTESQHKELVNYIQVINDMQGKIELQQERKSDNCNEVNLDDFVNINLTLPPLLCIILLQHRPASTKLH